MPLNLRYLSRPIKTFTYSSNETQSFDLPRNYAYAQLDFRLAGTLTIGTAAGTALLNRNPLGLIKKISIIADGKDTIKSITGADAYELNIIDKKVSPELTATGLTTAAHAFDAYFTIDFALDKHAKNRLDTLLQSSRLATFQIEVQWGTDTDMVTKDSGTTLALSSTSLEISAIEVIGFAQDKGFLLNKEYIIDTTVSASSSELQIDLPVGNSFRRLVIIASDAGVREDDIINNLTLKSGTEIFINIDGSMLQARNAMKNEQSAHISGVYVIDLAQYGSLNDILDVSRASSLELVLDVTKGSGTTKIKVIPQEIVVPSAR